MNPDPNNLEGPPRTREEMAENFRGLNKVAPTPAEKLQLMFGAGRPTPMTDANRKRICGNWDHQGDHVREFVPADVCAGIERQLAAKTEDIERLSNALRGAQQGAEDARRGIRHFEHQLNDAREDVAAASAVFSVPLPEPGSDMAKVMAANSILRRQLADALAQLRIADEQLALERGALAEARDIIRKMELAIQHHEKRADNALSDLREADSRTVRALHERNEAREEIERLKARIEGMEDDASEINERLEML